MKNEKHAMQNRLTEEGESRRLPFCIFHCMFFIFRSSAPPNPVRGSGGEGSVHGANMRNRQRARAVVAILLALTTGSATYFALAAEPDPASRRSAARKEMQAGNFKDAYDAFRALAIDPKTEPAAEVGNDLDAAVQCLRQLGRVDEADALREQSVEAHKDNWRLLWAAAKSYLSGTGNYGHIVAGQFCRGERRGNDGRQVSSLERDRVRAMQLMHRATPMAHKDAGKDELGEFYFSLAEMLLDARYADGAWRLQSLSDLAAPLPDYDEDMAAFYGHQYWRYAGGYGNSRGAPVNEDGTPVYHNLPDSWDDAKSDGERWRWCLARAAETRPINASRANFTLAKFLQGQFDVGSMNNGYTPFLRQPLDDDDDAAKPDETGPFAVSTLAEDETIARLATGPKRFKLPDEFNFIKLYQALLAENGSYSEHAHDALAMLFEDRQQYERAAEYWRIGIERRKDQNLNRTQRLNQIVGNWGMLEGGGTTPAGTAPKLPFLFRNGKKVRFEAREIDVNKLLADVKAYLKSNPGQIDWQKAQVEQIGHRIVYENQEQYLGKQVAAWDVELKPREKHFDRRITVETPLKAPGAYLVSATMENGNTSRAIVWVADTAIVKKSVDGGSYYFVADAATGKPVPGAKLAFFGWDQEHLGDNKYKVTTREFERQADADGQLVVAAEGEDNRKQWIVSATADGGRFVYNGYSQIWSARYSDYDHPYNATKVFGISDRPVYRPGQTVKFKVWVNTAKYDAEGKSAFAGQTISARIFNPKGDKILEKEFKADDFGGFDGELPLDEEATLGVYRMQVLDHYDGCTFRVEEYKKPEFEVTVDAPTEPVMLGEKITATINSKYYFGAPVTSAKVKYKVLRTAHTAEWYPAGRWDWMYGRGYWWFAPNYGWYPGWDRWGCHAPIPWWWSPPEEQPEVVSQNEVPVGPDGVVKVEIDTALAKALHGDEDHRYEITAEVTDQSRRTIVGTGTVSVARKPFKVYAWVDRGYYREGDVVSASFSAQTLDQKPVKGAGELKLLSVTYGPDMKPRERVVETWPIGTDAEGKASQQIKAAQPGQYRLSYTVTDEKKRAIEGGYLFVVRGDNFDGREFRFNDVEVIPDKAEYAPGDKVRLMINTARADSTVLLFVRPVNGVYLPPKLIRMTGKSAVEEFEVVKKDMPNVFVEAVTVADGRVFEQARDVVVPPENRAHNVEVLPGAATYKPGQKATIKLRVTDGNGEPVVGSAVLSLYDKSVEYISGGSNVPDIRAFFWKWRRSHHPRTESGLTSHGNEGRLLRRGETGLAFLGQFGHLVSDLPLGDRDRYAMDLAGDKLGALRLNGAMHMFKSMAPSGGALFGGSGGAGGAPAEDRSEAEADGGPALVQPAVRQNFADTGLWVANLDVKNNGLAEVEVTMPENLTTWKARVWTMSAGTGVGQGEAEVVTAKDLIVRLQAPRFFVQKDEVVLSANVHNYLASPKRVKVTLEVEGGNLKPIEAGGAGVQFVNVEPKGEARVDWRVSVASPGTAVVRVLAQTDEESDAMQMSFAVYVHGMLKTESFSGAIRPADSTASLTFNVPAERMPEQSRIEVRYSPSVAGAMVDALPYLVGYPYGCTEQTLNRFLPTVLTQRVLLDMGLDLKDIRDKRTNLNAQEIGDDPKRAADWKRNNPTHDETKRNPVFDEEQVKAMVHAGVTKLANQKLADGGWGWFSGFGEHSSPHTTATVVHGLQVAAANGVELPGDVLERGIAWLKTYEAQQVQYLKNAVAGIDPKKHHADNIDALVFMVLCDQHEVNAEMREFLYRDRTKLSVYCLAQLGLALCDREGQEDKLAMVMKNLSQYVVQDDENQTAYLKLPESNSYWWYWYGSDTEANAYYLKLLAKNDGEGPLAPKLAKYLINNRKHATYWNSTRDTALCLEALADYIRGSGEDKPDMTVTVSLDGKPVKQVKIDGSNLFSFDNRLVLEGPAVSAGPHRIEFTKTGKGPLYFNAYVTNFTLEEPITKAGLEIKVQRKFYRLVPVDKTVKASGSRGQAVDQKVESYKREPLKDGDTLTSGELVEVELEIDSKNDYEYILLEDMKASGFEPVDTQSGYNGNDLNAYMELRDERVCFFARALARGKHSVAYRLRAEIPGSFHALPTKASAMYAPELKANSDENGLKIVDAKEER